MGLIGSFIWLMKIPAAHIPAIVFYPVVGPIIGLPTATLGAALGSLISLGGKGPIDQKIGRSVRLILVSVILFTILVYLLNSGASLSAAKIGLGFLISLVAIYIIFAIVTGVSQ